MCDVKPSDGQFEFLDLAIIFEKNSGFIFINAQTLTQQEDLISVLYANSPAELAAS